MKIDVEHKIGAVFISVLVLGTAGILFHWSVPVALMGLYLIFGLSLTKKQWNRQSFADSFYYMGFSFTLLSLLVLLNPLKGNADLEPGKVLRYMGIALLTTVFGLIVRTVLVQFRKTIMDQEEDAREEIEELSAKLRKQMTTSIEGFENVALEIDSTLNSSLEMVKGTLENYTKQGETLITQLINRAAAVYQKVIDDLKAKFESIEIPVTIVSEKLDKALDEVPQLLSEFKNTLDTSSKELRGSATDVNTALRSVGKNISVSADMINRVREALGDLYSIYEQGVNKHLEQLGKLDLSEVDVTRRMRPVLEDLESAYDEFRTNLQTAAGFLRQEVVNLAKGISEDGGTLREAVQDIGELAKPPAETKDSRADIVNYNKVLKGLINNLEGLNNGISTYSQNVRGLGQQMMYLQGSITSKNEDVKKELDAYAASLRSESAQVSEVVGKVREVVTESIEFIKRKIS